MAKRSDRFVSTYTQGSGFSTQIEVWVDRETGVNYLWQSSGYGGGLTPLLKPDGTPVVTPLSPECDT
ncbi:MAG TPA: xylan 1,4-beta-xylosidase [Clostridiales bacterium]|nr:xylan 1,4-beta-xylosidase [Clostridiales bacterium]HCP71754.1 xylan 1,4-beta-xylosidase [Clostridiales bacterium]